MVRKIIRHPSPSLRVPTRWVAKDDPTWPTDRLLEEIGDLRDTLLATDNGLAIAHNQVFEDGLRLFVINPNVPVPPIPHTIINPTYWLADDEVDVMVTEEEGCLSFPGISIPIARHQRVHVNYTTIDGATHTGIVDGVWARMVQHECDHLDGLLFTRFLPKREQIRIFNEMVRRRKAGR
jgi:peptide deformylase